VCVFLPPLLMLLMLLACWCFHSSYYCL
jgi:hypothetical protein